MSDVVEQGREPRRDGLSKAQRLVVLVLLAVAAGFLVTRSGLLSADAPPGRTGGSAPAADGGRATGLVARVDDHLVRFGRADWRRGPRLPDGLPRDAPLVPVPGARGPSTLVGAHHGLLFRLAPARSQRWTAIGRAERVVGASGAPGRALVLRSGEVVEVDVATGRVGQATPFPGFDAAAGWYPEGVVSALGTRALLMSRPTEGGPGQELALAWPLRRVEAGTDPPLRPLGTYGSLLGVAADWVLTATGGCPGAGCRVLVVSVTRDDVRARAVAPPPGWEFSVGVTAGRAYGTLVPVQRAGAVGARALARLVAGGENALLVQDTEGFDQAAGLADAADGTVFLASDVGGPRPQVSLWDPALPGRAVPVAGRAARLPPGARLVCVCG